jgi:hypothetical protein
MDYEKMLKQFAFDAENNLYNDIMMDMFGIDSEEAKVGFEFVYALNRHGVSSKVIFEAFKEAAKGHRRDE